jgi:preprotein translocase subunit SecA
MLHAIDTLWVRHLTDLDGLREGIGLRAYGQQDPLVAYRKEASEMYEGLLDNVREIVARDIFRVQLRQPTAPPPRTALRTNLSTGGTGRKPVKTAASQTIGRNDPCPCGSGKKYKHCHGKLGSPLPGAPAPQPATSRPAAPGDRGKRRR